MPLSKIQGIEGQVTPNLGRRNLIINGAMQIAQRSTSAVASGNPGIHTIDRFHVWNGTDGAWTSEQSTDAPDGFSNSFKAQCTTADTSLAAGQYAQFEQRIEAQNLQHLLYGTANAKTLTLSFHCKSNKTGTYGIAVYKEDSAGSLSTMLFPVDFSISSANTWEKKTITISTDSTIRGAAGGITDDNGSGLRIFWNLASGSNFRTGTNSTWSTNTAHFATSNQTTNWMDNTSNNFYITGVQLEVGDTATDFEHRSYAEELALCQRYYYHRVVTIYNIVALGHGLGDRAGYLLHTPVSMRLKPSVSQGPNIQCWYNNAGSVTAQNNLAPGYMDAADTDFNQVYLRADANSNISGNTFPLGLTVYHGSNTTSYIAMDAEL